MNLGDVAKKFDGIVVGDASLEITEVEHKSSIENRSKFSFFIVDPFLN